MIVAGAVVVEPHAVILPARVAEGVKTGSAGRCDAAKWVVGVFGLHGAGEVS